MAQNGKKYRAVLKKNGDVNSPRSIAEGIDAVLEAASITKFDQTAEIHIRTNCDPRHADQIVRSTVILPQGTGKTVRVAVFCSDEKVKEATDAGADIAGSTEILADIQKGTIDFDVMIAEPAMMKDLAKAARILGPKGLMPSPKAGTVTLNIAQAVEELKKGKIEFRTDKNGIIHSIFGKLSFGKEKLSENLEVLLKAVHEAKPTGVKGGYIKTISLSSTMGPGIDVAEASE